MPFAMQWPAKLQAGQVYDEPVISLDIFAIATEYAGVQPKKRLDGVNIIPFITGEQEGVPHDHLFWRKFDSNSMAVRAGDTKLVSMNGGSREMYDLPKDIGEKNIISNQEQHLNLENAYGEWQNQLMNPIFLGLLQNDEYNELNPDRWDVEPY